MINDDTINQFICEHAYSKSTEYQYRYMLGRLALARSNVDPDNLSAQGLSDWLDQQSDGMRWGGFCAVRAYLRWMYGEQHPALRLHIKRRVPPPQRTLTPNQARKLLAHFENTPKGIRDRSIFMVLLDSGLRASELIGLRVRDVDLRSRMLTAKIKGGSWGHALIGPETADQLRLWMRIRNEFALPGVTALYVGIGGRTPGLTMTTDGLRVIMRNWGTLAGIGPLSPHDLRRSFATIATLASAPSRLVQIAGRWSDIAMVEHYTRSLQLESFAPYAPVSWLLKNK